ncbi:MAG: sugar phosphate isomerase/epimerase [Acidobacteriota bacterium]
MGHTAFDRRQFNQLLALSLAGATLPFGSLLAQGRKRNIAIGHTGITWPARPPGARRGGPPPATAGADAPTPSVPPVPVPAGPSAADLPAAAGARRGGGPPPPDAALNEAIFKDVSELGFSGLELFDWQITGLESQGVLGGFVDRYKLPLISSYTSINLTDPARRAETIAAAVVVANILKKYGGKTIVIGPSGRVGGPSYNFNDHKQNIVTTLNELGKAITDVGLIAALHQHTGTAVETRDETYATMEAVDTRYVKFGPDVGQLQKGGVDPVEVVRTFLPVVQHMHLKDWVGGPAMAGYCALGLGKVDLVGILDLMEGRTLGGMIMVELDSGGQMPYTPRESGRIAHDWLVKNGVAMKA